MPPQAPLKIVVLGALSGIKGADMLEAAALEAARRGSPVEFHLLGYGYRPLKTRPSAHLTTHGRYEEGELLHLLAELRPDLAWFPAQWPETYSYTLSAVLKAGLPVVVPNIGAFAERVQGRAWSWIRPWNASPREWLDDFIAIRERHFVPGKPPTLLESQASFIEASPSQEIGWSYHRDYLMNLRASPQRRVTLGAAELEPYLSRESMTIRLTLLAALTYLRSHPLLRGIASSIPARWRQRVNDWLSA